MTDDTELYGAGGRDRDSFDREYLTLMRTAREQGLRLWHDDGVFRLNGDAENVVFETDRTGLGALQAIDAFLNDNANDRRD